MDGKDLTLDNVIKSYLDYDEDGRLDRDIGPFEFLRTKELIGRYFPKPPAAVCDIGGGTGRYAFWLAGQGYHVDLVDLSEKHIDIAKEKQKGKSENHLRSIQTGDARNLNFNDSTFDAVLINGPLYHLTKKEDRMQVLLEAKRILRDNGVLICVAITKYASLFYALESGEVWNNEYYNSVRKMLSREFDESDIWYFHHPDEIKNEVGLAGFSELKALGVLGPAWMAKDFEQKWTEETSQARLLEVARMTESEPVLGPRTMIVAVKCEE